MKKKRFKKAAKAAFAFLLCIVTVAACIYLFFGAVLQESYKLNPPTQEEIIELKHSPYFFFAKGWE